MKTGFLSSFALFGVLAGSSASAALLNGSFESNGGHETPFTGWTIVSVGSGNDGSVWRAETNRGQTTAAQDGQYFATQFGQAANGYFYQSFATESGMTYDLAFYASRPQTNNTNFALEVDVFDGDGDPGTGGWGLLGQSITNDDISSGGTWVLFEYQFTAVSNETTLRFLDPGTESVDPAIDNVSVTLVPEPGSLALISLGGLALLRRRRSM